VQYKSKDGNTAADLPQLSVLPATQAAAPGNQMMDTFGADTMVSPKKVPAAESKPSV
jgi:hypothetical protein